MNSESKSYLTFLSKFLSNQVINELSPELLEYRPDGLPDSIYSFSTVKSIFTNSTDCRHVLLSVCKNCSHHINDDILSRLAFKFDCKTFNGYVENCDDYNYIINVILDAGRDMNENAMKSCRTLVKHADALIQDIINKYPYINQWYQMLELFCGIFQLLYTVYVSLNDVVDIHDVEIFNYNNINDNRPLDDRYWTAHAIDIGSFEKDIIIMIQYTNIHK